MNADERRLELNRVTEMIIGCAFKVGNTLGVGFLERVYKVNAENPGRTGT